MAIRPRRFPTVMNPTRGEKNPAGRGTTRMGCRSPARERTEMRKQREMVLATSRRISLLHVMCLDLYKFTQIYTNANSCATKIV